MSPTIIKLNPYSHAFDYVPPTEEWRKQAATCFHIECHPTAYSSKRQIPYKFFPSDKSKIVEMTGDGNCLFRALAYFITGKENDEDHIKIRRGLFAFLHSQSDDPKLRAIVRMDVLAYLKQNDYAIRKPAESVNDVVNFGTDVEVQVFAELLQCVVYVWNPPFYEKMNMEPRWKAFGYPGKHPSNKPTFFLEFKDGHHFNVVLL